jgi:hypothetical protein
VDHKLTAAEIRNLGFEWPKFSQIEEHLVIEDGKFDLLRTLDRLQSSQAYYKKQLDEAFAFKMRTGADYSDFTDRFDDDARIHRELDQAITYLQEIVAAAYES